MRRGLIPLLAAGNLVSAIGGGRILAMSSNVLFPSSHSAPFIAFLIGTPLGLLVRRVIARNRAASGTWLSLSAAGCSAVLLGIVFGQGAVPIANKAYEGVTFLVLCLYFGVWYIARSVRIETAAGQREKIPLVELCYYLGMIVGLLLSLTIGLPIALAMNTGLQLLAALIDQSASRLIVPPLGTGQTDYAGVWPSGAAPVPFIAALVMVTVGTQMVVFGFANGITLAAKDNRDVFQIVDKHAAATMFTWLVASIYIGAAISALWCSKVPVELIRSGKSLSVRVGSGVPQRLSLINWASAIFVFCAVLNQVLWGQRLVSFALCVVASILFEIVFLVLVKEIGKADEAMGTGKRVYVVRGYSLLTIAGGFALLIMVDLCGGQPAALFATLVIAYIGAELALRYGERCNRRRVPK